LTSLVILQDKVILIIRNIQPKNGKFGTEDRLRGKRTNSKNDDEVRRKRKILKQSENLNLPILVKVNEKGKVREIRAVREGVQVLLNLVLQVRILKSLNRRMRMTQHLYRLRLLLRLPLKIENPKILQKLVLKVLPIRSTLPMCLRLHQTHLI